MARFLTLVVKSLVVKYQQHCLGAWSAGLSNTGGLERANVGMAKFGVVKIWHEF